MSWMSTRETMPNPGDLAWALAEAELPWYEGSLFLHGQGIL